MMKKNRYIQWLHGCFLFVLMLASCYLEGDLQDELLGTKGTKNNPLLLTYRIHLTESSWKAILDEVDAARKYVALDLSACTMSDTELNAVIKPDISFGDFYIVSLVLPDAATSVTEIDNASVFRSFTNLVSVSGVGITSIGFRAFRNCTSLTSFNFPAVTSIGTLAFENCTSLTSVSIPTATYIGSGAFADCTSLISITLGTISMSNISYTSFPGNWDYAYFAEGGGAGTYVRVLPSREWTKL